MNLRKLSRRRMLLATGALVVAPSLQAQASRTFRVGLLGAESEGEVTRRSSGVRAALRELGYVEGKNLFLEARWADGNYDRLPALAAELIARKVDVIVAFGTKATLGAKRATNDTPIVMGSAGDMLALGVVTNLARPGGNITGSINVGREVGTKRLSLLKETVPAIQTVAYLVNPANPVFGPNLQALWDAGRALKISVQPVEVREPKEIEAAFAKLAKIGVDALQLQDETLFSAQAGTIARLAERQRIPSIGFWQYADRGGLLGYGVDYRALDRRAAYFVDRILKGAKPGELPIEQPTTFDLRINLRTAKAIGVVIPASVRTVAERVIE
jgi:putative tryptophan/tyrosine transport system substrate-binding protein